MNTFLINFINTFQNIWTTLATFNTLCETYFKLFSRIFVLPKRYHQGAELTCIFRVYYLNLSLSKPMLDYYWLDIWEQISVKFQSKQNEFHTRKWPWKYRLKKMVAILPLPQCVWWLLINLNFIYGRYLAISAVCPLLPPGVVDFTKMGYCDIGNHW